MFSIAIVFACTTAVYGQHLQAPTYSLQESPPAEEDNPKDLLVKPCTPNGVKNAGVSSCLSGGEESIDFDSPSLLQSRKKANTQEQETQESVPAVMEAYPMVTYKGRSPHCYPEYPILAQRADSLGDRCITSTGSTDSEVLLCDQGCFMTHCGCVDDKRNFCTSLNNKGCPLGMQKVTKNYCGIQSSVCNSPRSEPDNAVCPRGCEPEVGYPAYQSGKLNCNVAPPDEKEGEPCRKGGGVDAGWILVATGTHGLEVSIEVGLTTEDGKETTESMVHEISASMTMGVSTSVGGGGILPEMDVSLEVSAGKRYEEAVAESISSTLTQSKLQTIVAKCPDHQKFEGPDGQSRNSADGATKIEALFQYVATNGHVTSKTEHFRCHQIHNKWGEGLSSKDIIAAKWPKYPPPLCQHYYCD